MIEAKTAEEFDALYIASQCGFVATDNFQGAKVYGTVSQLCALVRRAKSEARKDVTLALMLSFSVGASLGVISVLAGFAGGV